MTVAAEMPVHLHHPPHQDLPHGRSDLSSPGHKILTTVALVLLVSGMQLQFVEIRMHLRQRGKPMFRKRKGALWPVVSASLTVVWPFGETVGEIETEHPGRAARVHLPRLGSTAVHRLNLKLTAKRQLIATYHINNTPAQTKEQITP